MLTLVEKYTAAIKLKQLRIIVKVNSSLRKYRTSCDATKPPAEPKALMIPKYFFPSSNLKELMVLAQKTETTEKLKTLYQI